MLAIQKPNRNDNTRWGGTPTLPLVTCWISYTANIPQKHQHTKCHTNTPNLGHVTKRGLDQRLAATHGPPELVTGVSPLATKYVHRGHKTRPCATSNASQGKHTGKNKFSTSMAHRTGTPIWGNLDKHTTKGGKWGFGKHELSRRVVGGGTISRSIAGRGCQR